MLIKKMKRYWVLLLFVAMGSCMAAYHKEEQDVGDHSFCVSPHYDASESECKKIKTFRAQNAYVAYPRAGFHNTSFVEIRFLYPSLKPLSIAEKWDFKKTKEMVIEVMVRWRGWPFEERVFKPYIDQPPYKPPYETLVNSSNEEYGLRLYSETSKEDNVRWQRFISANGNKTAIVKCDLPWRATDGSFFTDVSCRITSKLDDEYDMEYWIKRRDLPQWQEIDHKTRLLIQSFIVH